MLKIFKMNYHPQLVAMMVKSSLFGTISVNILTPFLLSFLFYDYIDSTHIYIWLILNIFIFIARIFASKALGIANQENRVKANSILKINIFILILSSLLHGYALWYSSSYISEVQLFFMATVTIALVSGSISTIGSVFHAFSVFVIFNLTPIFLVFSSLGGGTFYSFSVAVFMYMFVMLRSGYFQYSSLKENIELKESFEIRVKESIQGLKEKEKLLHKQARLAQMGEMISMIAHQWRQPLNAISATSSSINLKAKLGKLDSAYTQEMTDNISGYAQHLSETIDDFRNFFKPNKEKSDTSYNELLESVLKIIETSIFNNSISLIKDLECQDRFTSYPNELKQVILNLFKNAEDALLDNNIKNPFIRVHTYTKGKNFILELSDNAGGVSDNIIDKIFNPYFSTKKKKDGTGLGLYMSKLIIEEHCNGELSVQNFQDGAVFKITLGKVT